MPVQWTISNPHRLVIAVARDELRLEDVENYLDGVAVADALAYRKIFDTTHAKMMLSDADVMALGARIRAYLKMGRLGPLAIVSRNAPTSRPACSRRWPKATARSGSSASFISRESGSTGSARRPSHHGTASTPDARGVYRGHTLGKVSHSSRSPGFSPCPSMGGEIWPARAPYRASSPHQRVA